ncbi:MAG: histidine--tRNA ligase [Hyphomicrobiaceae bacterium]
MTKQEESSRNSGRPEARLPKGFRDVSGAEIRAQSAMLRTLAQVFELYGYEPLETSAIEFTDALGKFLPDQDRPNAGVFSFQDEDEQWMSLRYDMTAPLARFVAENFQGLPKPYRRYAMGPVFRNEKPGPGRFRQFMQCDADTVGTDNIAADAEACMLMASAIEALGFRRDQFKIKVNNRKVLDGVLAAAGIDPLSAQDAPRRLGVLRAIDKLDKFGADGVALLLGKGRKDESGDFTQGAGLDAKGIETVLTFVSAGAQGAGKTLALMAPVVQGTEFGRAGIAELADIERLIDAAGFSDLQIGVDASIVRGLDYYTGPVFEAELTFEVKNEDGVPVRFGSVGGGGRYDDLVARFTGERVPATGFSIGVSRLLAAQAALKQTSTQGHGPVVVLVMDKAELPRYQAMAQTLRAAGIPAEMYLGTSGMKPQMKYADRRRAPCVVIQGSNERDKGEIQIKDLIEGAKAASNIADNKAWKEARPAQASVPEADLVQEVRKILARHAGGQA